MKMTKCPEKHLYDADKYDSCPVCAEKNERGKTPKKAKVVRVRAVKARHSAEAEAKPSPKVEQKPVEAKTEPKAEQKPAETKPAPKAEQKPAETKPAPKAEQKPEEQGEGAKDAGADAGEKDGGADKA